MAISEQELGHIQHAQKVASEIAVLIGQADELAASLRPFIGEARDARQRLIDNLDRATQSVVEYYRYLDVLSGTDE